MKKNNSIFLPAACVIFQVVGVPLMLKDQFNPEQNAGIDALSRRLEPLHMKLE